MTNKDARPEGLADVEWAAVQKIRADARIAASARSDFEKKYADCELKQSALLTAEKAARGAAQTWYQSAAAAGEEISNEAAALLSGDAKSTGSRTRKRRSNLSPVSPDRVLAIVKREKDTEVESNKGARLPEIAKELDTSRIRTDRALKALIGDGKIVHNGKSGKASRYLPAE